MHFLFFSLINLILLPPTLSLTTAYANVTAIFAFGDSIVDSGNNNHLSTIFHSNHPPYGTDFPGRVPSGRFSNGKLPTDFLVSELGIKELLPAYLDPTLTYHDLLTGVSFASAGSGLDDLTSIESNVLSLKTQLRYFQQALQRMQKISGLNETERIVQHGLFMVSAGSNDMIYNFYYGLPLRRMYSVFGYQDLLLSNLESIIRKLYSMGGRRLAVMGLPPMGCLPVQVTVGRMITHSFRRVCINQQNLDSQAYNAKLQALTSRLQSAMPQSRIVYVDIYNPIMDMIMNPNAFGFERTLEGCCGSGSIEMGPLCNAFAPTCRNPSKYIFWDAAHPTQATYMILSKIFHQYVLPTLLT